MDREFVIITDSGCDISEAQLQEWGIVLEQLTFRFEGEDVEYKNFEMPLDTFYQRMINGEVARTAAVNSETFKELFKKYLDEGKDVLAIPFSSGISATFQSSLIAVNELKEEYPDRKIITIDSFAASAGNGVVLYLAAEKKKTGASIEEVAAYVEDIRLKVTHWFTVEDLVYLKRGGRISPTVAFVGNLLGVKPILHVDEEGHLVKVDKVRNRKASLRAIGDRCVEGVVGPIFISHANCYDDAKYLADYVKEKSGIEVSLITDIGPVIGSHAGPGTVAIFALSNGPR